MYTAIWSNISHYNSIITAVSTLSSDLESGSKVMNSINGS